MYTFILQIALMVGLGTMIYLIARAVPRIGDTLEAAEKIPQNRLDKFIASLPLEKIDVIFSAFTEKLLRKARLLLMKWDNFLSGHLNKFKKTNGEKEKSGLFSENGNSDKQDNDQKENAEI